MTAPYSYNSVAANGSTNTFAIPFPYLEESDIYVSVDGETVTGFTFPTQSTVQLAQTAASLEGNTVLISRKTALSDPVVTFETGGLDPSDLNMQILQLLYITQENYDAVQLNYNSAIQWAIGNLPSQLSTSLPPVAGVLWNNGGSVSVS